MTTDYWQLVDPVWDSLVQWDEISVFEKTFAKTDSTARALFCAHWLYSEFCNGGFHQFFWNSTGILALEAFDAYKEIGMPIAAEIVRRSISWFPKRYPREREERIRLLDGLLERIHS